MSTNKENYFEKYLNFENSENLCWLHATVALIVHSKIFKTYSEDFQECKINQINNRQKCKIDQIVSYNEAVDKFNKCNSELTDCKELLNKIVANATEYLKPVMKFKKGETESAFCALLNFIKLDSSKIKKCINFKFFLGKKLFPMWQNITYGYCGICFFISEQKYIDFN